MSTNASIYRAVFLSTSKRRKSNTITDMSNTHTFHQFEMRLQDIPTHDSYSIFSETDGTPTGNTKTNKENKSPPIYIQGQDSSE